MKILKLNIEGFRSLKNVEWRPGDLNVVIGPNASGKSNLLKAIDLISASARGVLAETIQSLGGMSAIAWDGSADRTLFDVATTFPPTSLDEQSTAHYRLAFAKADDTLSPRIEAEYLYRNVPSREAGSGGFSRTIIERIKERTTLFDDGSDLDGQGDKYGSGNGAGSGSGSGFGDGSGYGVATTELVRPDETILHLTNPLFSRSASLVKDGFSGWSVRKPFDARDGSIVRTPPISRSESQLVADGSNLVNVLHTLYLNEPKFKEDIDGAMWAVFGDEYEGLDLDTHDDRTYLRICWKSLKQHQSLGQISDGTLSFLYLITTFAHPSPPPLIAIDEPESGLHPRMFSVVSEFAAECARGNQVVFATHSTEFLNAISRYQPTVSITALDSGGTSLQTVDQKTLDYWLKDEYLGDMFAYGQLEAIA